VSATWKKPVTRGRATLVHADAIAWLDAQPDDSIHAVVTDPPYGVKEYDPEQLTKLAAGTGGVWRLPPVLDGLARALRPAGVVTFAREHLADRFAQHARAHGHAAGGGYRWQRGARRREGPREERGGGSGRQRQVAEESVPRRAALHRAAVHNAPSESGQIGEHE
jgi:hypothetical protein